MSEIALSALKGSRSGDRLIANAWYGGRVTVSDLDLSSWKLDWDASRQVVGSASVTVADVDGTLAPWGVDEPLGVGGAKLQLIYLIGGTSETVDLGWFRVTASAPASNWILYRIGSAEEIRWVSGGAEIPVTGEDLTGVAARDRLLASQSPGSGATVVSEVRRLLKDIMPVTVAAGVVDKAVSSTVVYERERMDAVEDLLDLINAAHRMTGDGQLQIYSPARTAPVWDIAGGDEGALISVTHSQSIDDMYNAAVAIGATEDGVELTSVALERSGPLQWEGPHWRIPVFQSSTGLLKTQAAVDLAAKTILEDRVRDRTVTVSVTCLPHPGLQVGDWVRVMTPTVEGVEYPLVGSVRTMTLSGGEAVNPMALSVDCSYQDVQVLVQMVRRLRDGR